MPSRPPAKSSPENAETRQNHAKTCCLSFRLVRRVVSELTPSLLLDTTYGGQKTSRPSLSRRLCEFLGRVLTHSAGRPTIGGPVRPLCGCACPASRFF